MQNWRLGIHSAIALLALMVSLLLFVFEYIAKPQIIFAASIVFIGIEITLHGNGLIKKSMRKKIAAQ